MELEKGEGLGQAGVALLERVEERRGAGGGTRLQEDRPEVVPLRSHPPQELVAGQGDRVPLECRLRGAVRGREEDDVVLFDLSFGF